MCRGVSLTSEIHAEIQMKSRHLLFTKNRLASEAIDLQALFNDYKSAMKHEFTVSSQS